MCGWYGTHDVECPTLVKYPTIKQALCRGGDTLAVDGVLLIAEHGATQERACAMLF